MKNPPPTSTPLKPRKAFAWSHACAYLLLVTVLCYLPALLPGRTFLTADLVLLMPPWSHHAREIDPNWHRVARLVWDPLFQFYPSRRFLAQSLQSGLIPWRNPYSLSGTPFIADGQSAVFYPLNWLFALLPLASAFGIVAALNTFLAGLFFTLFARQKKLAWESSLAGATVWMFCGTMVAWQMWQVVDATLCWIPLTLFFADKIVEAVQSEQASWRRSAILSAGLAVSLGMMLLGGHLQFAFCGLILLIFYSIAVLLWRRSKTAIPWLIGSLLTGLGVAAIQILPTLDFLKHSLRGSVSLATVMQTALPLPQLATLAMPEIAGGVRDWLNFPYLGAVNYYEATCYVGAAALLFAALSAAAITPERRRAAWFWWAIAALGLLIGCGSPLYAALYYGLPLFKSFHGISRMLILSEFAVATLCAFGVEAALERKNDPDFKRYATRATGAVCLICLALYGVVASRSPGQLSTPLTHDWLGYGLGQLGRAAGLVIAAGLIAALAPRRFAWLSVAVVAVDMLWFAAGLSPGANSVDLYAPLPIIQQAAQTQGAGRTICLGNTWRNLDRMVPDAPMSVGLSDIAGSNPLILSNYDQFVGALNTLQTGAPAPHGAGVVAIAGNPALDALNVQALISPVPLTNPKYKLDQPGDVYVYSNPSAYGEAWYAPNWTVNGDLKAGWNQLLQNPKAPPLISNTPQFTPAAAIPGSNAAPSVLSQTSQRIDLQASPAASELLILSEIADPAWKVSVDNQPADWITADGLLMAVPLSAGSHHISLTYRPDPGLIGLYITCTAWLLVAFCLGVGLATPFRGGRRPG